MTLGDGGRRRGGGGRASMEERNTEMEWKERHELEKEE